MGRILIIIIVLALIGGGVWWYIQQQAVTPAPATDTVSQSVSPSPSPVAQTSTEGQISVKDSSDTAFTKDLATVDAQLKALDTDSANADQGLNDQQISQAE
jgi:cytoskeletal protein RodZ